MKSTRYSIYAAGILALSAAMLTGCQDSYDAPELEVPVATLTPNTTLAEFKAIFGNELAVETPYKDEATKTPYIVHGRVVSSDATGNIYKSLCIQDETGALAFSVNQSSMYTDYRIGQEVVVNVTDLWTGQYSQYIQVGMLGDYNGNPQVTFMAYDIFNAHTQKNGLPNQDFVYVRLGEQAPADKPYYVLATISELNNLSATDPLYNNMMGQLVEIPNVSFVDAGKTPAVTYSTYQNTEDRYIQDASGAQLNVRNSGYSTFWNTPLPTGTGAIRGILSMYQGSWQLLLRGLDDVQFGSAGTKSEPLSVSDAINRNNNMSEAWVKGYIVGSLRSGLPGGIATSVDDIIFNGAATEVDNTLVIGSTPEDREFSDLMVVELPAGSAIREYGNLLDHPELIGHEILVKGELNSYAGMHGITNVGLRASDFQIEGVEIEGVTEYGSGTEDDPYLPTFIVNNHEEQTNIWVEGYIVGFVCGTDATTGAAFTEDTTLPNFGGNNFLLGEAAGSDSLDAAVPVTLIGSSFRSQYNLKTHPELFYKKVLIKADIAEVFGTWGLSNITEIRTVE